MLGYGAPYGARPNYYGCISLSFVYRLLSCELSKEKTCCFVVAVFNTLHDM